MTPTPDWEGACRGPAGRCTQCGEPLPDPEDSPRACPTLEGGFD